MSAWPTPPSSSTETKRRRANTTAIDIAIASTATAACKTESASDDVAPAVGRTGGEGHAEPEDDDAEDDREVHGQGAALRDERDPSRALEQPVVRASVGPLARGCPLAQPHARPASAPRPGRSRRPRSATESSNGRCNPGQIVTCTCAASSRESAADPSNAPSAAATMPPMSEAPASTTTEPTNVRLGA